MKKSFAKRFVRDDAWRMNMPKVELQSHELPYAVAEEMNTLRNNVLLSGADKRVIMLTSCASGDGKSTVSLELARSLSSLDKKVLLLDADMRKSQIKRKIVAGEIAYGLTHYLSGRQEMASILYETENSNVYLVPAGVVPPNPSELLSNERFAELVKWARGCFDYVIIDCPPLGMIVDAAIIAQQCDGSIFVITAGEVPRKMAQDVLAKLTDTGCPVMGVVLNRVTEQTSGYYYRYGYGYGYRYKYYEEPEKTGHHKRS
jgi:capsular exopolysaccharide synthesis family protein